MTVYFFHKKKQDDVLPEGAPVSIESDHTPPGAFFPFCQNDELSPVRRAEAVFQFGYVVADGAGGDAEDVGDFLVGEAPGEEVEDFLLAAGEFGEEAFPLADGEFAHVFEAAFPFLKDVGPAAADAGGRGDVEVDEAHVVSIIGDEEGGALHFAEDEAAVGGGAEAVAPVDEGETAVERGEVPAVFFHDEGGEVVLPVLEGGGFREGEGLVEVFVGRGADPCEAGGVGEACEGVGGLCFFIPPADEGAGEGFGSAAELDGFHGCSSLSPRGIPASRRSLAAMSWARFSTRKRWMSSFT